MKFRPILWLVLLWLVFLPACNFPLFDDDDKKEEPPGKSEERTYLQQVGPISVHPSTGRGTFTLYVGYVPGKKNNEILCYIQKNTGGAKKTVTSVTLPSEVGPGYNTSPQTQTVTFDEIDPGQYTAVCEIVGGMFPASAGFTVTDEETQNQPPLPANSGQPQKINGTGNGTVFSGESTCSAAQDVLLVVKPDNTAVITVHGPMYNNLATCEPSGGTMSWDLIGTAYPESQEIAIINCNGGAFDGKGTVFYAGGAVTGVVECYWNKGDETGKIRFSIQMP